MALIISILAFILFTVLLLVGSLGEASYCFLSAVSALLGLVLHGFGRLQELDLKNLRLVLREIEQTKKELFVREEKLKSIAIPLTQIIAFTGASEGRMSSNRESWNIKREWYRHKLQALVDVLELPHNETSEIRKYMDKYTEMDQALGKREVLRNTDADYTQVNEKIKILSAEIDQMMKEDVSK